MSAQRPARPQITAHAKQRWQQRIAVLDPDWLGANLQTVFRAAVPVGLPFKRDRGVLHPPSGALLIYKNKLSGNPVVVTILHAASTKCNDDHLVVCTECDLRFDAGRGPCPWCP